MPESHAHDTIRQKLRKKRNAFKEMKSNRWLEKQMNNYNFHFILICGGSCLLGTRSPYTTSSLSHLPQTRSPSVKVSTQTRSSTCSNHSERISSLRELRAEIIPPLHAWRSFFLLHLAHASQGLNFRPPLLGAETNRCWQVAMSCWRRR